MGRKAAGTALAGSLVPERLAREEKAGDPKEIAVLAELAELD